MWHVKSEMISNVWTSLEHGHESKAKTIDEWLKCCGRWHQKLRLKLGNCEYVLLYTESNIPDPSHSWHNYWATNDSRFLHLLLVARPQLCIPGSSVSYEWLYSVVGCLVSRWASLSTDIVKKMLCLHSWLCKADADTTYDWTIHLRFLLEWLVKICNIVFFTETICCNSLRKVEICWTF